jgi:hypothetical protein
LETPMNADAPPIAADETCRESTFDESMPIQ